MISGHRGLQDSCISGFGIGNPDIGSLTGDGRCRRMLRSWWIRLSRPSEFWSWNDFLHQRGLFSAAVLFTLLPLSIIMVERWGQHRVRQHTTAEMQQGVSVTPGCTRGPYPCLPGTAYLPSAPQQQLQSLLTAHKFPTSHISRFVMWLSASLKGDRRRRATPNGGVRKAGKEGQDWQANTQYI